MFFITALALDKIYNIKNSRCFGFYDNFEQADISVKENRCDIHEYLYDYVVIEEINPGIHQYPQNRWFYKFNHKERIFEPIEEPEELECFCNFALG